MKISIVGAGSVGQELCEDLSMKLYDVTLIEINEEKLSILLGNYDINGVVGNGATIETLREAQIEECDIFIAVTDHDEINLLSTMIAKELGAKYTVARVSDPQYEDYIGFADGKFGIDYIISPEIEAANELLVNMRYPHATSVESFFDEKIQLVGIPVQEESSTVGLALENIHHEFDAIDDILICFVEREHEIFIPSGSFIIQAGDIIHLIGEKQALKSFNRLTGHDDTKIKSVLIIGAANIAFYLVPKLICHNVAVKVIEQQNRKALALSALNPKATVIVADGSHPDVLNEAHLDQFDAFVPLTGIDEENIVIGILARRRGVKKVLTRVERIALADETGLVGNQAIITPHRLFADKVLQIIRSLQTSAGSSIEKFYRLANYNVELTEFVVEENHRHLINQELRQLNLKNNILIAAIYRDHELLIPSGNDRLLVGDRTVIVSYQQSISELEEIIK